jgi:hypothetical protein
MLPLMRRRFFLHACLLGVLTLVCAIGNARAQSGSFVVPAIRAQGGTDFAYWDLFARPPDSSTNVNYNYPNPPALIDGLGEDAEGNPTTAFAPRTALIQSGTPNCFITSSGAIYSFSDVTAFEVPYSPAAGISGEVTNVIFQTQTGGSRLDIDSLQLSYVSGGQTRTVAPIFHALDDPQAGTFGQRIVCAFQWNLTGLGVRDFKITFSAPDASMPLWEAQLDVVVGSPFVQQLGYLLIKRSRPLLRHGVPGTIVPELAPGEDPRFFLPGAEVTLNGVPELDWAPVGWWYDNQVHDAPTLELTFPAHDITVTALFAPLTYVAWRDRMFNHANGLTGTENDYLNDAISAPDVDHDCDGLDNLLEYAFGCDPYIPDTARAQDGMTLVEVSGQMYPAITYRTNGAPIGQGDVEYHVQLSQDRSSWIDNRTASTTVTMSRVRQQDGTVLVTERAAQSVSNFNRCFMRVVVE